MSGAAVLLATMNSRGRTKLLLDETDSKELSQLRSWRLVVLRKWTELRAAAASSGQPDPGALPPLDPPKEGKS
jgi:hypothetical protein